MPVQTRAVSIRRTRALRTVGVSAKAKLAALAPAAAGVVLIVVAALFLTGGDQDVVRSIGIGLVIGGPVAGGAAYRARPGNVEVHDSRRSA